MFILSRQRPLFFLGDTATQHRTPLLCVRLIKTPRYSEAVISETKGKRRRLMWWCFVSERTQTEHQTRLRGLMAPSINKRSAVNYWAVKVTLGTTRRPGPGGGVFVCVCVCEEFHGWVSVEGGRDGLYPQGLFVLSHHHPVHLYPSVFNLSPSGRLFYVFLSISVPSFVSFTLFLAAKTTNWLQAAKRCPLNNLQTLLFPCKKRNTL